MDKKLNFYLLNSQKLSSSSSSSSSYSSESSSDEDEKKEVKKVEKKDEKKEVKKVYYELNGQYVRPKIMKRKNNNFKRIILHCLLILIFCICT